MSAAALIVQRRNEVDEVDLHVEVLAVLIDGGKAQEVLLAQGQQRLLLPRRQLETLHYSTPPRPLLHTRRYAW